MIDRFGITIDWRGATLEALTAIALQADYSGCGYLWIPEAWGLESFSTIGHLLTVTKRIKIGTGIANVFSRSAATLAMASATLNQLAPGRFLIGIGVSGKGLVESFHGAKFEKTLKRTQEYVEVVRKIEAGEIVDYVGEILKLSRFRLFTKPVTSPTPIFLGAIGKKNLALAGKISDGAIVTLYPISKLNQCRNLVNQESGSSNKKVFAYIPLYIVKNEREEKAAKSEVSKLIFFYVRSMGRYYVENLAKLGYSKEIESIRAAMKGDDKLLLGDDFLSDFALIGTPAKILDRVVLIPDGIHPVFGLNASSREQGDASAREIRELSLELAGRKPRRI